MPDSPNSRPGTAGVPAPQVDSEALLVGTCLAEFEIREVVGAGGFGIVYRAWDRSLEREVALKEYMPVSLAGRGSGERVTLRSQSHEEDFVLGLRSFVNEARLLARFDQPALVKVFRFWEANGTAYMAMPLYRGRTLRQLRKELGPSMPDDAWARALIDPLLGALEVMHGADVYHRDIAPDNILWCDDGRPVLLDFGAARLVLADRTQNVTAILKPQFAPIEQYAQTQSMRQGPWTDLYALAGTCYFMLTGRAPLPATARVMGDELEPLARLAPPGCSPRLLEVLDWAMAVRPQDRPPSVAIFRDALAGQIVVPARPRAAVDIAATPPIPTDPLAFEKTVQATTQMAATRQAPASNASDPEPARPTAPPLHAPGNKPRKGPSTTRPKARPLRALLLCLVAATVVAGAWMKHRHRLQASIAGPEQPALSAGSGTPAVPAHLTPKPTAALTNGDLSADAASSAATPLAAASAARGPGPREICADLDPSKVGACVKRLCDDEPRYQRYPICLRVRRQEELQTQRRNAQ